VKQMRQIHIRDLFTGWWQAKKESVPLAHLYWAAIPDQGNDLKYFFFRIIFNEDSTFQIDTDGPLRTTVTSMVERGALFILLMDDPCNLTNVVVLYNNT